MRQRTLLIVGVAAVAAAPVVAVSAAATALSGSPFARPAWTRGGMMGGVFGSGGGDVGMDRAVSAAGGVAASYPGGGLAVDEVIEFSNGYYAWFREESRGVGAFDGMTTGGTIGGRMMGGGTVAGGGYAPAAATPVTSDRARVNGNSGAVRYHSWHGSFVQMRDLGA